MYRAFYPPIDAVKIWQYQLEKPGGQRFGPSWMHRKEAEKYMTNPVVLNETRGIKLSIVKYWIEIPKNKLRGPVKAEIVK